MMTTPVATASIAGFQTLLGTLPMGAELPGPGTFLGVGPDQYRTAAGAAAAIESAYVLGLDALFGVLRVMISEDVDKLGDYVAAVREDDWARAGSIQRQLAEKVGGSKYWAREIAYTEKIPAWQQHRDEILLALTRGDKYSAADRIKVGEYRLMEDLQLFIWTTFI